MLVVALPLGAAILWVVFAVPGDPSRSGETVVTTPGWVRLLLELSLFGAAVVALVDLDARRSALALGAVVVLHYGMSYDRVLWLLRR